MPPDPLDAAGKLAEETRHLSDMLTGAVTTLITEGWTEQQARDLVVAMFVNSAKGTPK